MAHWTKTSTGYALRANTLTRVGRRWSLVTASGATHDLGTRARFDHAEALIIL